MSNSAKYFFYEKQMLPPNVGFQLFGLPHLLWLALSAVFCVAICYIFYKTPPQKRDFFSKAFSIIIFTIYPLRMAMLISIGQFDASYLPFQLCRIAGLVFIIYAFTKNETAGYFAYLLCLPGGVVSILFPDWTCYPELSYISINSFILHAFLIAFPLMHVLVGDIRPKIKNLWKLVLSIAIIIVASRIVNSVTGQNYFLVTDPSSSPELLAIADVFGNPGYIFSVLVIIAIVWVLLLYPLRDKGQN